MHSLKHWITHNWFLKIFSLLLAMVLWITVASETSSEIGLEVPLEYRNIPPQLEITEDTTNTVEVRLRGSPNLIKDVTPKQVSTNIDLSSMKPGEIVFPLTSQNVQAPFGAEVVRVNPSRVRINLERTISKMVPVVPKIQGPPARGFEVGKVSLDPSRVRVEGPESRVNNLDSVSTLPVSVEGKRTNVSQSTDLDAPDPLVRLPRPSTINIRVEIRAK
jgi:YbbR domain-containing protein